MKIIHGMNPLSHSSSTSFHIYSVFPPPQPQDSFQSTFLELLLWFIYLDKKGGIQDIVLQVKILAGWLKKTKKKTITGTWLAFITWYLKVKCGLKSPLAAEPCCYITLMQKWSYLETICVAYCITHPYNWYNCVVCTHIGVHSSCTPVSTLNVN